MAFADITLESFVLTQFGILGVSLWVVGWVLKNCFDRWLNASEKEHERKLKSLETEHLKRLELLNKRDEIQFSKLHETRAIIIADIFRRFVSLQTDGMNHLSNGSRIDVDKIDIFSNQIKEVQVEVLKNRIYFTRELSTLMSQFLMDFYFLAQERAADKVNLPSSEVLAKWAAHWKKLSDDLPKLLNSIEDEFRTLLGVEVTPPNSL